MAARLTRLVVRTTSQETVRSSVPARGADPVYARSYVGARYYRPDLGRFTSADDSSFLDPYQSGSANLYAHAFGNPLRWVDPTGHEPSCGPFGTDYCEDVYAPMPPDGGLADPGIDPGLARFLWDSWYRGWELAATAGAAAQDVVQMAASWAAARPDPGCVAGSTAIGASVFGVAGGIVGGVGGGAGGASGGTLVAPGVGTIGGGAAGAALGYAQGAAAGTLAGGAVGAVVGSIACRGGGGGGGGGSSQEYRTADEIISRDKKGSIRQVFPAQHLSKTLGEIRRLAATDRAAKTALKLLTDGRFNK